MHENQWSGRENEAVNLFALGFLLKGTLNGPRLDPTQIGIEVAVANAPKKGKNAQVRKDLVIWPKAGLNRWYPGGSPRDKPQAILEWKVRRLDAAKPRGAKRDLAWLKSYSTNIARPDFVGYCVYLDLTSHPACIAAIRVAKGQEKPFSTEPI